MKTLQLKLHKVMTIRSCSKFVIIFLALITTMILWNAFPLAIYQNSADTQFVPFAKNIGSQIKAEFTETKDNTLGAGIANNTIYQIKENPRPFSLLDGRKAAQELIIIQRSLENALANKMPPNQNDLVALKKLAIKLYPAVEISAVLNEGSHRKWMKSLTEPRIQNLEVARKKKVIQFPFVCPESPVNTKKKTKCKIKTKISELVTVVVDVCEFLTKSSVRLVQLVQDFKAAYPGIHVIAACNRKDMPVFKKSEKLFLKTNAKLLKTTLSSSHKLNGNWSSAFLLASTPFVLVARGIHRFDMDVSPLDRMIRVLTETPGVAAVGGAVRNSSRHWKTGCFQSELSNYVLRYQKGYHNSYNDCMFCDYVDGPFLTYTSLIQKATTISPESTPSVAFQEFFLNLSANHLTMACPDVMFYADAPMAGGAEVLEKNTWLHLAKKLELNRVLIEYERSHVLHRFTCIDANIDCSKKSDNTYSYTMPVCCREEMVEAFKIWDKFCLDNSLNYELFAGSLLGSIKMTDIMPWDFNGDFAYEVSNYTFIKSSAPKFKEYGLLLNSFHDPTKKSPSFMYLWSPNQIIHLQGKFKLFPDTSLQPNISFRRDVSTLMEVHGAWFIGPLNPGNDSLIRFRPEILRHAQHWQDLGFQTSSVVYKSGKFEKCDDPFHHACLDALPADGSLAFRIPEW